MSISLKLLNPLLSGNAELGDYTSIFRPTWRRTSARLGGNKIGTVDLTEKELTITEMAEFFRYGLMRELREKGGGQLTWQGYVAAMEWQHKGTLYTLDVSPLANAQRGLYRRLFDNMLVDGSAEAGAWTVYNGPSNVTVVQSTAWSTDGGHSCLITVTDTGIRGARISGAGYGLTIVSPQTYTVEVRIKVVAGSWRISVNRSDTDASLAHYSTHGALGEIVVPLTIDAQNTYAGTVDYRITSEASIGSIYADSAIFKPIDVDADTGWQADAKSVTVYGRKEQIDLWGGLSYQAANARLASNVLDLAWPQTDIPTQQRLAIATPGDKLSITFAGYWSTLNWLYTTLSASGISSDLVRALIAQQSTYVLPGTIETNLTPYTIEDFTPLRLGDVLKEIAESGTDVGSKWSVGVWGGRRVDYLQVEPVLSYKVQDNRLLNVSGGEMEPWLARPGWAQFDDLPLGPQPGSGRAQHNPRWRYLEEIEMLADGSLSYSRAPRT